MVNVNFEVANREREFTDSNMAAGHVSETHLYVLYHVSIFCCRIYYLYTIVSCLNINVVLIHVPRHF